MEPESLKVEGPYCWSNRIPLPLKVFSDPSIDRIIFPRLVPEIYPFQNLSIWLGLSPEDIFYSLKFRVTDLNLSNIDKFGKAKHIKANKIKGGYRYMATIRNEKEGNFFRIGVMLFLGVIFLWILCFILILFIVPKLSDSGLFGDSFGVLNTLFSGLAFVGVIIAIFMQKEELSLQREEVKMQRIETARLADTQEKSTEILAIQADAMRTSAKIGSLSASLDAVNKSIEEASRNLGSSSIAPAMILLTDKRGKIVGKLSDILDESLNEKNKEER